VRRLLLFLGTAVALGAFGADRGTAASAASSTWPPFVLVAGLLLIGRVAFDDEMFDQAAALTCRIGGSGRVLLIVPAGTGGCGERGPQPRHRGRAPHPALVLAARR
jgi:hypothetical protein